MSRTLIKDAMVVNEGQVQRASVLIENDTIAGIFTSDAPTADTVIDAAGKWLLPGVIDDHVHFRDPGLTHKADMSTESLAAAMGGVTTIFDMPNCVPQTVTLQALQDKFDHAAETCLVNHSFYLGATHTNLDQIEKIDPAKVCGVKLFMGSSTGGMLLDDAASLKALFRAATVPVAVHCEETSIIDSICTIPTSGITYEFTRMVYEILGLNVACLAGKFTSYDLLEVKDVGGKIDYGKIAVLLTQAKPFNTITLHDTVAEGDEKVKFDVVVGNPPYQISDGGAQASAKPIYNNFVAVAKELRPSYMTMIMPTRWYAGGKGLDDFRNEMLDDPTIQELHDFLHPEEVFPGTNNRGGICYLLWNALYNNRETHVTITTHEGEGRTTVSHRDLRFGDLDIFVRYSKAIDIIQKVISNGDFTSLSNHISPRRPFGLDGNFIRTEAFHDVPDGLSSPVKCYGKARSVGYIEHSAIRSHVEWIDKWKVFMPYANNIGTELNDDNQNTFVVMPGTACTETFLIVGADMNLTEQSASNLSMYLQSKFARFLLSQAKISQHGTAKTYIFVPTQDFSKPWTDEELYAKYHLTPEEIAFIEATIKPMN